MPSLVPSSIRDAHHLALDAIAEERSEYDLEQLVPLLVDNLDESALVHLAEQMSVLGVEGWNYADTVAKKRELIKNAVQIHQKKGTPWSIKDALTRAGFVVKRIEEGTRNYTIPVAPYIAPPSPLKFDGTAKFNGAYSFGAGLRAISPIKFNGQHKFDGSHKFGDTVGTLPNGEGQTGSLIAWALFRVVLTWDNTREYTPEIHRDIVAIIEAFKNARSWLTDVGLEIAISEEVAPVSESLASTLTSAHHDVVAQGVLFNGSRKFDGSFKFTSGVDDTVQKTVSTSAGDTITMTESVSRTIT
jgi:hypothetical protein